MSEFVRRRPVPGLLLIVFAAAVSACGTDTPPTDHCHKLHAVLTADCDNQQGGDEKTRADCLRAATESYSRCVTSGHRSSDAAPRTPQALGGSYGKSVLGSMRAA